MNNILKHSAQLLLASCLILSAGCSDNLIEAPESVETSAQRLVLTASTSSPDTRMSLGQNGITTMWEPGDQLVLYKKSGGTAPIYMNTNIQTASSRAAFESDGGVPAGEYWVFYNYNDERVFHTYELASVDEINNQKRLSMYGEINVTQGMANASVTMKHMYAQVTIQLKNPPQLSRSYQVGMYSPSKGFSSFQMFTASGMMNAAQGGTFMGAYGWQPSDKYYHNKRLGEFQVDYDYMNGNISTTNAEAKSALIFPVDLREEEVFFYVLDYDDVQMAPRCYEFKKASTIVNFQAGYRYKVVLDMNSATVTTLADNGNNYRVISDVDKWRHAAYRGGESYVLTEDLDFDGKYFFPLEAMSFDGGNHTLSNITLDRSNEEYVGAFTYAKSLKNLTLSNVIIKGKNYVGGFGNNIDEIDNCKIIGTSKIQGTGDFVGGICGVYSYSYGGAGISNVSIGQNCTVEGQNYVGGIVGWNKVMSGPSSFSMKVLSNCSSEGTVTAQGNYAGGIFGRMGSEGFSDYTSIWFEQEALDFSVVKCVNKGNVKGNDYVGGVGGALDVYAYCNSNSNPDIAVIKSSLNQGNVEGNEHVGGILGSSMCSINTCYSIESVKGTTSVGGILGGASMMAVGYSRVANCYSLATVTATGTTNPVAGGIVGLGGGGAMGTTVMYSYFAGTCSTNFGIIGKSEGSCTVTSCLSTTSSLGDLGNHMVQVGTDASGNPMYQQFSDNVSSDSQANITSILNNINVINGEEAYCTNVWSGYNYDPVKFASFSAETDAPDFGVDTIN